MVGGRAPEVANEIVFAFEFPERPGALLQFLSTLGSRWNISLFHYRNHGSAFGRVLCGFEAAPGERDELLALLRTLGFDHSEESGDPAVELFLK
jgi:threonine dehydratase